MNDTQNKGSRIKNQIETIDYSSTQSFFKNRASKFKQDNPYSVTMYQDNNPTLVRERNQKEADKLLPLLELDEDTKFLDIACGIGRWSDAIKTPIQEYCGIDFSADLIQIARERNKDLSNRSFLLGSATEITKVLEENQKGLYHRALMVGILMYLNDADVITALSQVAKACTEHAIICLREPIGIEDRLTLKDFYSDELQDNYNAIYRTRAEFMQFFEETLLKEGFVLNQEDFLFSADALNNRKETAQYYYIFKR